MREKGILAIDQGTSGSKAIIFSPDGRILAGETIPVASRYPLPGRVEQDPEEIYTSVIAAVRAALEKYEALGGDRTRVACCGISNQRETFLLWDPTGKPYHPAVVWQCKRSINVCERLKTEGAGPELTERTGLIIDPYFSGTKLTALLEENPGLSAKVRAGQVLFGTVDSWLLYRLTGGAVHATDYTNASRTLLLNLNDLEWDETMKQMLDLQGLRLPEVRSSSGFLGQSDFEGAFPAPLAITAMIGDSHAAAFGERCLSPGSAKATLGTGSSLLMNTGTKRPVSGNGMVSTICWSAGDRVDYALEGIIVSCGSTITWMRDQMGFFAASDEANTLARSVPDSGGVSLIPAFAGLGAPYWKMEARALISGMTFGTQKAHVVRAGLESIAFQIKDVIAAMEKDSGIRLTGLQADGGLTASGFVMEMIAELLAVPVNVIALKEASALGAALLAGLGAELISGIEEIDAMPYNSICHRPGSAPTAAPAYERWSQLIRNL